MNRETITAQYLSFESIKGTAKHFGISEGKVRKILIDAGLYANETSRAVAALAEKGLSPDEIADRLKVSKSTVHSYLPYSKGDYNNDHPTKTARLIRACRQRKLDNSRKID